LPLGLNLVFADGALGRGFGVGRLGAETLHDRDDRDRDIL